MRPQGSKSSYLRPSGSAAEAEMRYVGSYLNLKRIQIHCTVATGCPTSTPRAPAPDGQSSELFQGRQPRAPTSSNALEGQ